MSEEIELGDLSGLADGELRCFDDIGRDGIVVCRAAGQLYALADNCSHADTPLSEGRLRGFGHDLPVARCVVRRARRHPFRPARMGGRSLPPSS